MARTPTTPTLTLCDNLVDVLAAAWVPKSPDEVRRTYAHIIDFSTVKGRLVLINPAGYTNFPATRGHDWYDHRIRVGVFERYTTAADPDEIVPQEWLDERVDFVHTQIVAGFEFARDGTQPSFNKNVQTLEADVVDILDPEDLARKEFWCEIELLIREQRSAN